MKNILLIPLLLSSYMAFANSTIFELNVNPKETEEFKKPLPELYVFNLKDECIYNAYSFTNEEDLFVNLDYLFGISNEQLPGRIIKSKFIADFKNRNPSLESLPEDQKEKIISDSLERITSQILPKNCSTKINKIYGNLLDKNGKSFNPKNKQDAQFTVIEFSAEWCIPCKQLEAGLNKYIKTRNIAINWLKVERDGQKIQQNFQADK